MSDLPASHLIANEKLEGEAYFDLFEIHLKPSGVIYLHNNSVVEWQSNEYTGWSLRFNAIAQHATEERSRPTFSLMNIDGAFNQFVQENAFNKAQLKRYRVLKQHIVADSAVYQERVWLLWNPRLLNNNLLEFEVRSFSDGQNFTVPARKFMPPDWSYVSLG